MSNVLRTAVDNVRRAARAPALLLAAALCGCAVDQQKETALHKRVTQGSQPTTRMSRPDETLTLDRALILANQHNERIALSGEDYVQLLVDKRRAVAAFLPTVSFGPSFTVEDRGGAGGSPGTGSTGGGGTGSTFVNRGDTRQRFEAPVGASIGLSPGDFSNVDVVDATIDQRRALLLDVQASVLLNAAQTYYQVLRSERLVRVLESSLSLQEARVRDIQGRQRAGLARPLDVAQTEAQASGARVQLAQARGDVVNGRTTLAFVIGEPLVAGELLDRFAVPADLAPQDVFITLGDERRQDLRAARAAVVATRASVDVAVARYYPSISLDLQGFLYRENFADASKWDAVLSANFPIFSAGLIEADVRTAWSRHRQALLNESLVRRQVLQDVRSGYQNLQTSFSRLAELDVQVRAAAEAFRQADQSYTAGLATNLERITAQDQLLNAQLQQASEDFTYKVAYLTLLRVSGRLGEGIQSLPTTQADAPPATPGTSPAP